MVNSVKSCRISLENRVRYELVKKKKKIVIFKRLPVTALSALQEHKGEGVWGNGNNYTNVSLRLCKTVH